MFSSISPAKVISRTRALLIVATVLAAAASVPAQAPAAAWWKHVVWLSDDTREGRAVGSEGYRKAAEYVAGQFRSAGLTPGAGRGYSQRVELRAVTVDRRTSSVAIVAPGGGRRSLDLSSQLAVNGRGRCGAVEAGLAFVGYGLSVPELGHDDLAGQDLEGKVAVYVGGAPAHLTAALVAHRQGAGERWRVLKQRGAIGQMAIFNPYQPGADWQRTIAAAQQPTYALADAEEFADRRIAAVLNHDAAAPMFEGSGHDLAALLADVEAGRGLPRFPLQASLRAELHCSSRKVPSENVVGIREGRGATARTEYVVITAHLDHIGRFGTGADTIHNGAMDNASGVASLIDLAERLGADDRPLERSVALVALTGEESGLLGSYYFARRPALPARARMVANINLDMFLPIIPMKSLIAFGMEESSLERDVAAAAAAVGVTAERDPIPAQNAFIRSDQYNFVRVGVPAVMLLTGAGGDAGIWKTWEHWMETRYHRPSDDTSQPVNFESAEMFQRALVALVRRVADADSVPEWNADSVFNPRESRP